MRTINKIVIHASDSWYGNAILLNEWHKQRGFTISKDGNYIGYHKFITNGYPSYESFINKQYEQDWDGRIFSARYDYEIGCHVKSLNNESLGVCMIGKFDNLLPSMFQLTTLLNVVIDWMKKYKVPLDNVLGHREAQMSLKEVPTKTCPGTELQMGWIRGNIWRQMQEAK